MNHDQELDDGLAAFDQLERKMAETNRLLLNVHACQVERDLKENALSDEMRAALKEATEASQNALQASKAKIRTSLLWTSLTVLLSVLVAFGGGYFLGNRSGTEKGQAEGYQSARDEKASAAWANTPAGQRALIFDQHGNLEMVAQCQTDGWKIERQHGQNYCFPYYDSQGKVHGWAIP